MPGKPSLLATLLLTGCSVVGVRTGTEEPHYTVIGHQGPAEIRRYDARIAAETTVDTTDEIAARGTGFRRLAGYIFGANTTRTSIAMTAPVSQASEKIAMTAPVATNHDASGWTIRFFMPAGSTLETLPQPKDPAIRLVPIAPQTSAVIRFTGSTGPDAVATQQALLLNTLADGPWQPEGQPVAWFYDPPWTLPFFRRNEVAVPVQPAG
jgi:hypothetical protein